MLTPLDGIAQAQPAQAPTPSASASLPTVAAPKEYTFPAVTYACIAVSIPDDEKAAEAAINAARLRWYEIARRSKLERSSSIFIHGKVPQGEINGGSPVSVDACGIVVAGTTIEGMTVRNIPARKGLAGFCSNQLDVQACLARALKDTGFTDAKPWPWLPMYARWPVSQPAPAAETDVLQYLHTANFPIPYAPSGKGATYEHHEGPKQIVACNQCTNPSPLVNAEATGKGIGWFIPLR